MSQDSRSTSQNGSAQTFLTAQEVGAQLRLPLSTVYHLAKSGVLPAIQLGRTWRFPTHAIAALTSQTPKTARILVVDDDEVTRLLLREVFESQGHTIIEAGDAESGLAAAQRQPFDLLLIDFKLPGRRGTELIRELRSKYSLQQMVMITAFANVVEMDELFALGAVTVLRKPLDAERVLDCVERILSSARNPQAENTTSAKPTVKAVPAGSMLSREAKKGKTTDQ